MLSGYVKLLWISLEAKVHFHAELIYTIPFNVFNLFLLSIFYNIKSSFSGKNIIILINANLNETEKVALNGEKYLLFNVDVKVNENKTYNVEYDDELMNPDELIINLIPLMLFLSQKYYFNIV